MIPLRYAATLIAALCLITLSHTPNSPATTILAGLFLTCFAVVCFTCRETTQTRRRP